VRAETNGAVLYATGQSRHLGSISYARRNSVGHGPLEHWILSLETTKLIELTVSIVTAQAENNVVSVNDLPGLIKSVHAALEALGEVPAPAPIQHVPAISVRASVKPEAIACLECGKKQRTLKRHLANAHGLTPAEYRTKWDLPASYPMVAPAYSAQRSDIAKATGLGRKAGSRVAKPAAARTRLGTKA